MKRKISRSIFALMLAVVALLSTTVTAFAAGTETWSEKSGPWEKMRVTNKNTTPIKTMGRSGKLNIAVSISGCRGDGCNGTEPTSYPPVKVTCKILSYPSGEVLGTATASEPLGTCNVVTYRSLNVGEKIQLFFDVSSQYNPPGAYRKAHISYAYQFK